MLHLHCIRTCFPLYLVENFTKRKIKYLCQVPREMCPSDDFIYCIFEASAHAVFIGVNIQQ